jgi:hypothetical protein
MLGLLMAADPRFRPVGRADATAVWFSALVKSKCIAPADSTAAETRCNRKSKLKAFHLQWLRAALICRNYEFLDDSWEKSFCLKFGSLGACDGEVKGCFNLG